jgi:AbrB family transcriptional regulator (stage V sporulation protein T)
MKANGIVRRIDDLGRVVIPKEIRRTLRIREGDPLEIFTKSDGEVIFKKYSPMGELSEFSGQYSEVLNRTANSPIVITDRDHVISVSGLSKKDIMDRRVSLPLEDLMESREKFIDSGEKNALYPIEGLEMRALVVYPVIASGDIAGSVIFMESEGKKAPDETDIKLCQVAAAFLGKQMEE